MKEYVFTKANAPSSPRGRGQDAEPPSHLRLVDASDRNDAKDAQAHDDALEAESSSPHRGLTIAVVESSDVEYATLRRILRGVGPHVEVRRAATFLAAREAIARGDAELFLVGHLPPSGSSAMLIQLARAEGSHARFILLAGRGDAQVAHAGSCADEVVTRALLSSAELRRIVRRHLLSRTRTSPLRDEHAAVPDHHGPDLRPGLGRFMRVVDQMRTAAANDPEYGFTVTQASIDISLDASQGLDESTEDALMCAAYARIQGCLRSEDHCARLVGGNFVILLSGCATSPRIEAVLGKLRPRLEAPYILRSRQFTPTVDLGTAVCTDGRRDFATLLAAAGERRQAAHHRRKTAPPPSSMRDDARRRRRDRLRLALERGEIRAHVQPIVALHERHIVGWEALARWQLDDQLLTPTDFLAEVRALGLERQLDLAILRAALTFIAARPPSEWVSVNIFGDLLRDGQLVHDLAHALCRRKIDASRLRIEVHGADLDERVATISDSLKALAQLGVAPVLDDFGGRHTRPGALLDLPFRAVKLDRSLTRRAAVSNRGSDLLSAMVSLAYRLDLGVVAKGVEHRGVLDALAARGVSLAQGYLLGAPASPREAVLEMSHAG